MDTVSVFKRTWPYIMHEVEERSRNIHLFMLENKVYGNELWEKLTPKILSELKVESESLQLRGIVDRVEIYERGYVPIELKTGKMPKEGMWPGHRIQIAAYTLLLEEKFNKEIKECFVNYLDAGARRQLTMNPFMKEEIIELVNEIQNLLEKKNIPTYTENRNKCVNCGLKERCHDEEEVRTLITHTT
jgi:CRISPR-associated protein Cas4